MPRNPYEPPREESRKPKRTYRPKISLIRIIGVVILFAAVVGVCVPEWFDLIRFISSLMTLALIAAGLCCVVGNTDVFFVCVNGRRGVSRLGAGLLLGTATTALGLLAGGFGDYSLALTAGVVTFAMTEWDSGSSIP